MDIFLLCKKGGIKRVEQWLDEGGDVNERNDEQKTPLHSTSKNGRVDVVRLLIEKGADVNSKDAYGETALDATRYSYPDVIKFIESYIPFLNEMRYHLAVHIDRGLTFLCACIVRDAFNKEQVEEMKRNYAMPNECFEEIPAIPAIIIKYIVSIF